MYSAQLLGCLDQRISKEAHAGTSRYYYNVLCRGLATLTEDLFQWLVADPTRRCLTDASGQYQDG